MSSQIASIFLLNFHLSRSFPCSQPACLKFSGYCSTCFCICNCFHNLSYTIQFNCQEATGLKSTSDRWWCTTYLSPASPSIPTSMILKYLLWNILFFSSGSCCALLQHRGVVALDGSWQPCALWLLLPHFMYVPFSLHLFHTYFGTDLRFLFLLPNSPAFNCTHSHNLCFFPCLFLLLS